MDTTPDDKLIERVCDVARQTPDARWKDAGRHRYPTASGRPYFDLFFALDAAGYGKDTSHRKWAREVLWRWMYGLPFPECPVTR
jgi:hypothetical protein